MIDISKLYKLEIKLYNKTINETNTIDKIFETIEKYRGQMIQGDIKITYFGDEQFILTGKLYTKEG